MEEFPLEIKQEIVSFLNCNAARRQLRLANKKWYKLVDYRDFVLYRTKKSEWKQIVDRLATYNKPISITLQKNILKNTNDIREHLTRLVNLSSFVCNNFEYRSEAQTESDWSGMTTLTNLKSFSSIHLPHAIWKKMTQLEELRFCYSLMGLDQVVDVVKTLTNLQKLTIEVPDHIENPFSYITDAHSKLTYLDILFDNVTGWTEKDLQRLTQLKYLSFFIFAKERKKDLQRLSLHHMTNLEVLHTTFPIESIASTKLRELDVDKIFTPSEKLLLPKMAGISRLLPIAAELDSDHLTALTNLESLEVEGVAETPQPGQVFSILGSISSTKLRSLSVKSTPMVVFEYLTRLGSIEEFVCHSFHCWNYLTSLSNLTSLDLTAGQDSMNNDAVITHLAQLTKLKTLLFFPGTTMDATFDLSPLTNLVDLTLVCSSSKFIGLENLTQLTSLWLPGNPKVDYFHLPFLANLTNIRKLVIDDFHSNAINYVSAMTDLNWLSLYKFNDEDELLKLTNLAKLTGLERSSKDSKDVKGIYLTRLTKLQELYWQKTPAEIVQQVEQALPDLRTFDYKRRNPINI